MLREQFASKSKQAQEAHEAIRPAGETFVHPADSGLDGIELKLYDLIWKRTLASQMAEAKKKSINAKISSDNTIFAASGMKIVFPGYLRVYVEGKDSPEEALEDQEVLLPNLKEKDVVDLKKLEPISPMKPLLRLDLLKLRSFKLWKNPVSDDHLLTLPSLVQFWIVTMPAKWATRLFLPTLGLQ